MQSLQVSFATIDSREREPLQESTRSSQCSAQRQTIEKSKTLCKVVTQDRGASTQIFELGGYCWRLSSGISFNQCIWLWVGIWQRTYFFKLLQLALLTEAKPISSMRQQLCPSCIAALVQSSRNMFLKISAFYFKKALFWTRHI